MKVVSIVGARPQFIKAAAISRIIRGSKALHEVMVHTGQHYEKELSDVFYEELDMPMPKYNLGIGSDTHGGQTGRMIVAVEHVLLMEKPDWALVYGDTNSTLAGSIAAAKLHVPIAHVEAGLRSFNRLMPEEINRVLSDHASDLLFAPTETAVANLKREGIDDVRILLVGDVMYDAALYFAGRAEQSSRILATLNLCAGNFVLATIHRAENTDNPARLEAIVRGLAKVAQDIRVILPLHPRTRIALSAAGLADITEKSLSVISAIGYVDMTMLEKHASLIATDSGGVQKEAFFWRVPCVTLRDETEWIELVELGWNRICSPTSGDKIAEVILASLETRGREARPYGEGNASELIVNRLLEDPQ